MLKCKKCVFISVVVCSLFFVFSVKAASFEKYAPKLLRFEGKGYGIHKAVWGEKDFSKSQALQILRREYWDKYHGNAFKHQEVAEVFIDHLINAGPGKENEHIKAFEAIIGVPQNGILSLKDIERANSFYFAEQVVNPYVKYRIYYYHTRKKSAEYPGWVTRAASFFIKNTNFHASIADVSLPADIEKRFRYVDVKSVYAFHH